MRIVRQRLCVFNAKSLLLLGSQVLRHGLRSLRDVKEGSEKKRKKSKKRS